MPVLRSAGHDVEWVGDWSRDPGDEQIRSSSSTKGSAPTRWRMAARTLAVSSVGEKGLTM